MRTLQSFLIAVFVLSTAASRAAELDYGPQDPNAEKLVQQLGDEIFEKRTQALEALKKLGPQASKALSAAAADNPDPEIKARAVELLPGAIESITSRRAYECWKKSLPTWQANLKEGRLSGLLLGAPTIEVGPVRKVDANTAGVEPMEEGPDPSLRWLAKTQEADGHWNSIKHGAQENADIEQTALALLSMLGAGHTEKVGGLKQNVRLAIKWLVAHQREDGAFVMASWEEPDGVAHALAGIAIAEAAGMARIPDTVGAAQKAVDYSTQVHQYKGPNKDKEELSGFGRSAGSVPDVFCTGVFALQLKSSKVAGLRIDRENFVGAISYLESLKPSSDAAKNDKGQPGLYPWVAGGKPNVQATLFALLARQFMGAKKEELTGTAELALQNFGVATVGEEKSDVFFNYIGCLVAFQQGGELWKTFNEGMKQSANQNQHKDGAGAGSWDPSGLWSGSGRVMTTATAALTIEVYYRYLPMFKAR